MTPCWNHENLLFFSYNFPQDYKVCDFPYIPLWFSRATILPLLQRSIAFNSSLPILHFGGARRCGGCPLLSCEHHVCPEEAGRSQRRIGPWPGTCCHMTSCVRSWALCAVHVTSRARTANCRVYGAIAGHPPRHASLGSMIASPCR